MKLTNEQLKYLKEFISIIENKIFDIADNEIVGTLNGEDISLFKFMESMHRIKDNKKFFEHDKSMLNEIRRLYIERDDLNNKREKYKFKI